MTIVMAQSSRSETGLRLPDVPPGRQDTAAVNLQNHLRGLIEDIVASVFAVEPGQLRRPTRGRARIALARQVAMYIVHVGYGLSLTEVGRLFDRDRTTVSHACSVVETRRDDPAFDEAVVLLELIVRAIDGARCFREPGAATPAFGPS